MTTDLNAALAEPCHPAIIEYTSYEHVLKDLYRWNIRSKELIGVEGTGTILKTSLQNMEEMAAALGNPQDSFKIIHVAGTNGKGSVCLKTATALQAAGLRTGLFTSPHISCFRERIRVGEVMITEEKVVTLFN